MSSYKMTFFWLNKLLAGLYLGVQEFVPCCTFEVGVLLYGLLDDINRTYLHGHPEKLAPAPAMATSTHRSGKPTTCSPDGHGLRVHPSRCLAIRMHLRDRALASRQVSYNLRDPPGTPHELEVPMRLTSNSRSQPDLIPRTEKVKGLRRTHRPEVYLEPKWLRYRVMGEL